MTQTSTASVIVSFGPDGNSSRTDTCGPAAASWLSTQGFSVAPITVLRGSASELAGAVTSAAAAGQHLVVIAGGTGLGAGDNTPQVVDKLCDYAIPGVGELLRRESLRFSLTAFLSRAGGWVKDRTLVLALPGESKALVEQLGILADLLPQALKALRQGNATYSG